MITLAFPSLVAPTALVTLPDVEKRFGLPAVRKRQNSFVTDADTHVIYDYGSSTTILPFNLGPLSDADADAVQAFFADPNGANGRAGVWQLQRSNGKIYTVSFAQDVIDPDPRGVSWTDINLTLLVLS